MLVTSPKKDNYMSNKKLFMTIAALAITFLSCTIAEMYGPFMGKVVDAKTGEPINGAVVLIAFYTKAYTLGGWSGSFADTAETLTDGNGEFRLPTKFVFSFRFLAVWDEKSHISIFKPGYGAYPLHPKTFCLPKLPNSMIIPENYYITFYLPQLPTTDERRENLSNIRMPVGATDDKMMKLTEMENEEYKYLYGP